jgi:lipoprotein-anchoring transpeptidase ErfK/SrfK
MFRLKFVLFFNLTAFLFGACVTAEPPTTSTSSTTTSNSNTPVTTSPVPSPSPAPSAPQPAATNSPDTQPVPLPVLDAFFSDESFAADAKNGVGLTDEQIARLKEIARTETGKLREDSSAEQASTASARKRADDQVKGVIGSDKAAKLYAFVHDRWSGGEVVGPVAEPNAVPTDTRLVVNIPAYRMDLFQDGNLVKTYKVGIGYPEFPLPTGMRKADTVVFNPTWTPPDEPWVESANKVKPGQKIPAGSKLNPLGPAKIPIGLPSLIHGGKQPSKIGTFASHGCVGLTTPQLNDFIPRLATLSGSNITQDDVANYEEDKTNTKSVKLNQKVPVDLRYETIVVEDGKLHIYRDVYEKDTNTEENLEKVLAVYGVAPNQLSGKEKSQIATALRDMSRDPQGNLNPSGGDTANQNENKKKGGTKSESSKVTRTIKGQKEVVIDIAALHGKGYPTPVELDTGGAPQGKPATAQAKRKK